MKILIADRGEPAIRVMAAVAELGWGSVGLYTQDDAKALHTGKADSVVRLAGQGRRAYADVEQLIAIALAEQCDAIHPGAGELACDAGFASACSAAGVQFLGASPEALERLDTAQQPTADGRRLCVHLLIDQDGEVLELGIVDRSAAWAGRTWFDVCPAVGLGHTQQDALIEAARTHLGSTGVQGLCHVVFSLDVNGTPRLLSAGAGQTAELSLLEELSRTDLVAAHLRVVQGERLAALDMQERLLLSGSGIQARVVLETLREDGQIHPASGRLSVYEAPSGPGVRTYGCGYGGYETSLLYDTALAKVVAVAGDLDSAKGRLSRALNDFRIIGVATNLPLLRSALTGQWLLEANQADFLSSLELIPQAQPQAGPMASAQPQPDGADDPDRPVGPDGSIGLSSPMQGTIVGIDVVLGDEVRIGQVVAAVEAMKLQHDIKADRSGVVCEISMAVGDVVKEGYPIVFIHEQAVDGGAVEDTGGVDLDAMRGDMREFYDYVERHLDNNHDASVAQRHSDGARTPRENIADLMDEGSFRELGPAVAGSAAGGAVLGFGTVNADLFGEQAGRVALIHNHYDTSITTNGAGHYKQEPIHELVHDFKVPLVLFSEGEGQPYISDKGFPAGTSGFDGQLFSEFAKLSGLVPLVGVATRDSFAANATLLSCCDVIIATRNASIGMGAGPGVVEASGLGRYSAEDLGSMSFQVENGDVDIVVDDDAAAVAMVKQYLSYFQGDVTQWQAPDQRRMRHIIPENRVRTYAMRDIIDTLADEGSVLELRKDFGIGVITSLIRVEGRPLGLVANNPAHLAGAVDSPGADKGARFLQLCDAFDIPVVVFMDCPGIMVGPDHERTALVRHAVRMFNVGCNCSTAMFGVMVRKAYGLGVQAMCGGSAMIPMFNVAWPTAEFAGMNIDGAVKLSARRELMAIEDPEARKAAYDKRVADSYETARAINSGARYVIDPADTRAWVARGMKSLPPKAPRTGKKRPYVDTW